MVSALLLGGLFAGVFALAGVWLGQPAPAWLGAGAVALASAAVLPFARRLSRSVVFRGRVEPERAVADLARRLSSTLDIGDVPAEVAAALAQALGARSVVLRRWGQTMPWAAAGKAETGVAEAEALVEHLGLPVATLTVQPRPGESSLASADRAVLNELATAAAPALHGARLASAFPELTDRERQVLAGIVRGLPNVAIAARLGVSTETVANYVSIVLTKLRVPDKERAAELARRRAAELS